MLTDKFRVLLTPTEVAKVLKISRRQVLRLSLRRVQLGPKTIRYYEEDVYAYAALRVC